MANPPKPLEQKRLLGNPGGRPLPKEGSILQIQGGRVDPIRPLDWAGQQMWDSVFSAGELWVSSRTDVQLLQMVCEQLDRKVRLEAWIVEHPDEWHMFKQLNDLERLITSNLSLLGFTPSDRTRLGLAEVKRQSKLEALIAKRDEK
jgi:Phage terminase, small subunit